MHGWKQPVAAPLVGSLYLEGTWAHYWRGPSLFLSQTGGASYALNARCFRALLPLPSAMDAILPSCATGSPARTASCEGAPMPTFASPPDTRVDQQLGRSGGKRRSFDVLPPNIFAGTSGADITHSRHYHCQHFTAVERLPQCQSQVNRAVPVTVHASLDAVSQQTKLQPSGKHHTQNTPPYIRAARAECLR